jgi:putative flippase GtrA
MEDKLRALLKNEIVRFVFMGGVNTGLTWLLYLVLNLVVSYQVSFTLSYVAGIVLSYVLNARYVFDTKMSLSTFLQFPVVYVVQYMLNIAMMYGLVELARCPESLAPLVVTAITVPVTYVMSRFILKPKTEEAESP